MALLHTSGQRYFFTHPHPTKKYKQTYFAQPFLITSLIITFAT